MLFSWLEARQEQRSGRGETASLHPSAGECVTVSAWDSALVVLWGRGEGRESSAGGGSVLGTLFSDWGHPHQGQEAAPGGPLCPWYVQTGFWSLGVSKSHYYQLFFSINLSNVKCSMSFFLRCLCTLKSSFPQSIFLHSHVCT